MSFPVCDLTLVTSIPLFPYLMQFRLHFKFLLGCNNVTADVLSRMTEDFSTEQCLLWLSNTSAEEFVVTVTDSVDNTTLNSSLNPAAVPYEPKSLVIDDNSNDASISSSVTVARNGDVVDVSDDSVVNKNNDGINADSVTCQEDISNVWHNGDSFTVNNDGVDFAFDWNNLPLTEIEIDHYLADSELGDMYQYLSASVLTGDDKKDRMILLLSDQFYLRNDLLWKLSFPRNKTEQRLRPMSERLCVPKIFLHEIVDYFHQHSGHLGTQRLFFTLAYRVYWNGLFEDIRLYCVPVMCVYIYTFKT